jgi:hypothetical protein
VQQGWHTDPWGRYEHRWFSHGTPTALVRTSGVEARDEPDGMPPPVLPVASTEDVPAVAPRPVWIEPVTPRPLRRRLVVTVVLMMPMLVVVLLPVGRMRVAAGGLMALTYLSLGILVWASRLRRNHGGHPDDRSP